MKKLIVLFAFLFSSWSFGWNWNSFSMRKTVKPAFKIHQLWFADMLVDKKIKPHYINNSPPLITDTLVIQGNPVSGVKAYTKKEGKLVWHFPVKSGVASPMALYRGNLYFGGGDGFFYSLKMESGDLNWKFFTDSENSGAPLVYENKIYWMAGNQKLYALSSAGKLLWLYSESSLSNDFVVFGRPRPALYKNLIYTGFYNGRLVALDRNTGRLKWRRSFSSSQPIKEDLELEGSCLFVSVFNDHLFCLEPRSGKTIWKARGGSSSFYSKGLSVMFQFYGKKLYAVNKKSGKVLWEKKIESDHVPFSPVILGKYLIYGFPSQSGLVFVDRKNGKTLGTHQFGRGLAGPIGVDSEKKEIYFPSIGGYLYKISLR